MHALLISAPLMSPVLALISLLLRGARYLV
jgi:hypothetical protein